MRRVLEALRGGRVQNLVALPAFVFQTALHICQQHSRSTGREGRALQRLHRGQDDPSDPGDPLRALIGDEQRAEMRRAMERLDPGDRDLLRMLYYEQLESADAAKHLGISLGALRVRKHRVLERLANQVRIARGGRNDAPRSGT